MTEVAAIQGGDDNGFNTSVCTSSIGSCNDAHGTCRGGICKGGTCDGDRCVPTCPYRPDLRCHGGGLCVDGICRGSTCDGDDCYDYGNTTTPSSHTTPSRSGLAGSGVDSCSQLEKKKIMVLIGFLLIASQQHEIRHAFS